MTQSEGYWRVAERSRLFGGDASAVARLPAAFDARAPKGTTTAEDGMPVPVSGPLAQSRATPSRVISQTSSVMKAIS